MAHHGETTPPRDGENRGAIAGLRQVDPAGQANRVQQAVLAHCIERLAGRVEISLDTLFDAVTGDIEIRPGVSDKDGTKLIVATVRRG